MPPDPHPSPFVYEDSASTRAGIVMVNQRLVDHRLGVVGVGGTGSYILDLISKTPVAEIHIFDNDVFLQHNAFRSPGAALLADIEAEENKAVRLARLYCDMHNGIVAHPYAATADNVDELTGLDFVFLCMDAGSAKKAIVEALVEAEVPFIDVGLGIDEIDGRLQGSLRVTTFTPGHAGHLADRIALADGGADADYGRNIQIAELNALNAALAVLRWKKHLGFYVDLEGEHNAIYLTSGNEIINEDRP
jgi:hypothetical protein